MDHHGQVCRTEAGGAAKGGDVQGADVHLSNDSNIATRRNDAGFHGGSQAMAVATCPDPSAGVSGHQRSHVVDGVQIARRHVVIAGNGRRVVRLDQFGVYARLHAEVMQSRDRGDHACERARHLHVGDIGKVGLAIVRKVMNAGPKGGLSLRDGPVEGDEGPAVGDTGDRESLAGEPRTNLGKVGAGHPELCAELGRREPLVVARTGFCWSASNWSSAVSWSAVKWKRIAIPSSRVLPAVAPRSVEFRTYGCTDPGIADRAGVVCRSGDAVLGRRRAAGDTPIPRMPTTNAEVTRSRGRERKAMDRSCLPRSLGQRFDCTLERSQIGEPRSFED